VATTWRRSFSFICISNCLELSNLLSSVVRTCFAFYCCELECPAAVYIFLYILPTLKSPHPERQPKQAVVKN
jgi:hypothetical protein